MRTLTAGFTALTYIACSGATPRSAGPPPPSVASPLVGAPLPTFKREALGGRTIDLASARGSVTVVKFFAKYCEPCKRTLPAAEALHKRMPAVVFIGVGVDDSPAETAEVVTAYRLSFPVVHDRDNVLSGRYRVTEMPTTFVADASGGGKSKQGTFPVRGAVSSVFVGGVAGVSGRRRG